MIFKNTTAYGLTNMVVHTFPTKYGISIFFSLNIMLFLVNVLVPKTKWPTRKYNSVVEIKKKDEYATL